LAFVEAAEAVPRVTYLHRGEAADNNPPDGAAAGTPAEKRRAAAVGRESSPPDWDLKVLEAFLSLP
jgi:hypothetical protein